MGLKELLFDIFFKIDSYDKLNTVLGIFQTIATISAFLHLHFKDNKPDWSMLFIILFIISQLTVLLFFMIVILISGKYRPIKLRLNRNTGVLYDDATNFRNIALRDDTLNIILDNIDSNKNNYEVGKIAGEDFYRLFKKELERKENDFSNKQIMKKWLEYDSSSGIGKFELLDCSYPGINVRIKITSPFTGSSCPGKITNNICTDNNCGFIIGYLEGFISKLFSENLKYQCTHNIDPQYCEISFSSSVANHCSLRMY